MSLHTHQTIDGETTAFKCWRSVADGKPCVYVEIHEGYTTPGWAGGDARRTTLLRLTKDVLEDLAHYFTQLADAGEPDQSESRERLTRWAREDT